MASRNVGRFLRLGQGQNGQLCDKATKRGCLQQFGLLSQPSSLKKQKTEDLPKTLVCDEKKTKPVSTNAENMA